MALFMACGQARRWRPGRYSSTQAASYASERGSAALFAAEQTAGTRGPQQRLKNK